MLPSPGVATVVAVSDGLVTLATVAPLMAAPVLVVAWPVSRAPVCWVQTQLPRKTLSTSQ